MSGPHDAKIAALWNEGIHDTKAIGAEVGISTRSVCRALVREGVRDLKARREFTLTQPMLDLLVDGASYADVAETFHVDVKRLRDAAPGYGWDGATSGMLAHALKNATVRRIHNEIRRIPLPI